MKLFPKPPCARSVLPARTRGDGKRASMLASWKLAFSPERLQAASLAGRAGPVPARCHPSSQGCCDNVLLKKDAHVRDAPSPDAVCPKSTPDCHLMLST